MDPSGFLTDGHSLWKGFDFGYTLNTSAHAISGLFKYFEFSCWTMTRCTHSKVV